MGSQWRCSCWWILWTPDVIYRGCTRRQTLCLVIKHWEYSLIRTEQVLMTYYISKIYRQSFCSSDKKRWPTLKRNNHIEYYRFPQKLMIISTYKFQVRIILCKYVCILCILFYSLSSFSFSFYIFVTLTILFLFLVASIYNSC